jgi:SSS family solute:Na+ symporter
LNFAPVDWVIVVLYLAGSLAIGILGKKFVGDVTHFLVAGRELGVHIGIATLAATEIGTITFMYFAELGYKAGFAAFCTALISGIVMIIVGRTGFVVQKFRELKLMTVPEYFQVKYSQGLRILTGCLVAIGGILNMGIFLKIEGQFLTRVSGIPADYLVAVMTAILLLELVYTVLGGMVSVVITDFLQYVLLSVATILVTIYAVNSAGWDNITQKVTSLMGSGGWNPLDNPKFGWTFLIWQVLLWFAMNACWQTTMMRVFATNSPSTAKRVMTWTGVIFLGRGMLPMLWGICALTLLGTGPIGPDGSPTPMHNGQPIEPIEAMPIMISELLGPGVRGIVVAGMLAATMSVNSSYLLGWSSVISQDIIMPIREKLGRGALDSKRQIFINRVANLFVSLFVMFWGLYYPMAEAAYLYLTITGTIFLSGAFVSVVGGLYWKHANVVGGYAAMLLGAAGAIVPFFFLKWDANITGFSAFAMAAIGLIFGSLLGRQRVRPLTAEAAP